MFLFCFLFCVFSHRCFLYFSITGRHQMSLINKQRAIRRLVLHNVQQCQVMMKARTFNDILVSDGNVLLDDGVSDDLKYILQYHMGLYSLQNQGDFVLERDDDWEYRISHMTFVDHRIWFMMCFHTKLPEDEPERIETIDLTNDDSDSEETDIDEFIDDVDISVGEYDTDEEDCEDCHAGQCNFHINHDDD